MGTPQKDAAAYARSDAIADADKIADPLLLIHGMSDDNVFFENSSELIAKLQHDDRAVRDDALSGRNPPLSAGRRLRAHRWNTIIAVPRPQRSPGAARADKAWLAAVHRHLALQPPVAGRARRLEAGDDMGYGSRSSARQATSGARCSTSSPSAQFPLDEVAAVASARARPATTSTSATPARSSRSGTSSISTSPAGTSRCSRPARGRRRTMRPRRPRRAAR